MESELYKQTDVSDTKVAESTSFPSAARFLNPFEEIQNKRKIIENPYFLSYISFLYSNPAIAYQYKLKTSQTMAIGAETNFITEHSFNGRNDIFTLPTQEIFYEWR